MIHGDYTGEEAVEIDQTLTDLANLWNAYTVVLADSEQDLQHAPPSLSAFFYVLSRMPESPLDDLAHLTEDEAAYAHTHVIELAGAAFIFGQWCLRRGLLAANMIQCRCTQRAVDETLQQLFPEGGEQS